MGSEGKINVDGILLVYHHPFAADAATVMENVNAFAEHSRFRVWSVNTALGFPKSLSQIQFQTIVLHYSALASVPYLMDEQFHNYLEQNRASYKVAFFQDEHHNCGPRFDFLNTYQIDCVYTLLEPAYFPSVYGKYTKVPKLVYHIPGYVSSDLPKLAQRFGKPYDDRTIDVGYRARPLPFYMGRGAQEKTQIAAGFVAGVRDMNLRLDIRTDEQSRIYGDAWYKFTANCRGFLGVEAGTSIFDLDGSVQRQTELLLAQEPDMKFAEMSERFLSSHEDKIFYRTISPRHFEAAAFRVVQILFEGKYSGAMEPMVHFIPLKKDFSNLEDCVGMFLDETIRLRLTENAYEDLIASGRYGYQRFIAEFDELLLAQGLSSEIQPQQAATVSQRLNRDRRFLELRARKNMVLYGSSFPGRHTLALIGGPLLRGLRKLRTKRSAGTSPNSTKTN